LGGKKPTGKGKAEGKRITRDLETTVGLPGEGKRPTSKGGEKGQQPDGRGKGGDVLWRVEKKSGLSGKKKGVREKGGSRARSKDVRGVIDSLRGKKKGTHQNFELGGGRWFNPCRFRKKKGRCVR